MIAATERGDAADRAAGACRSEPGGPLEQWSGCLMPSTALAQRQHLGNYPAAFGLRGQLDWLRVSLNKKILLRE